MRDRQNNRNNDFFFEFVTEKIISLLLWLLRIYSFSKSTKEVINYVQRAWYCPNTFPRNTGRTKYKINNTNTDILLFLKWKYRYRGNENLKQIKRIIYFRKYLLYLINLNHIFGAPRESLRCSNCLPFASTWVHPHFFMGSMLLILLVFCVALLYVFTFRVPCCRVRYDFRIQTMFGS